MVRTVINVNVYVRSSNNTTSMRTNLQRYCQITNIDVCHYQSLQSVQWAMCVILNTCAYIEYMKYVGSLNICNCTSCVPFCVYATPIIMCSIHKCVPCILVRSVVFRHVCIHRVHERRGIDDRNIE